MRNYYRNLFLVVAVISTLFLTACGGGGGGGNNNNTPATSNITVSIDGSDLNINGSFRAATDGNNSIILKTTAYLKGSLKNDIKVEDRKATKSGSNYICNIQGLINGYDYRFSAYLGSKKLMENQLASSELQNNAEIPVNVDTSIKTLAYDSWKDKKPSNASVENFKQNSENLHIFEDKDFQTLFDPNIYKQSLEKIVKGDENASLPTKKDIDTNIIATTDVEATNKPVSGSEQALIGKWYLNYVDNIHQDPEISPYGYVYSIEFKKDHTFTDNSNYYGESFSNPESRRASVSSKASMRFSENQQNQEPIATGTWSLENNKIVLNYTSGNKQNDHKEIYKNIVVNSDSLTWSYSDTITYGDNKSKVYTYVEIYKKSKWSKENKMPEPASLTKALIGDWTLSMRNGVKVNPNSQGLLPSYYFFSDHSYAATTIYMNSGKPEDYSTDEMGTWYYEFGVVYLNPISDKGYGYEQGLRIDIDKNTLKVYDYEFSQEINDSVEVIYNYTKKQSDPGNQIPIDLTGTWYLNYEEGKPVPTNAKGEVSTLTLNSDGSCTIIEYGLIVYEDHMYPTEEFSKFTGRWNYSNGNLTTTIDGETMSSPATLANGELTITGTDEETKETFTSVYRKIKYPK